jgi:hypothetical protein
VATSSFTIFLDCVHLREFQVLSTSHELAFLSICRLSGTERLFLALPNSLSVSSSSSSSSSTAGSTSSTSSISIFWDWLKRLMRWFQNWNFESIRFLLNDGLDLPPHLFELCPNQIDSDSVLLERDSLGLIPFSSMASFIRWLHQRVKLIRHSRYCFPNFRATLDFVEFNRFFLSFFSLYPISNSIPNFDSGILGYCIDRSWLQSRSKAVNFCNLDDADVALVVNFSLLEKTSSKFSVPCVFSSIISRWR